MHFIETKALGGRNFIRADFVTAVTQQDAVKSYVFVQGAANAIPCTEPADQIVEKIEATLAASQARNADQREEG